MGVFGNIRNPFDASGFNVPAYQPGTQGEGLIILLNNLVKMVVVFAGLYTFWNIILAGYLFMSAGGEPKNIAKAWSKIWQSLLGLVIVAGSFLLAGIFGYLIFNDVTALISPKIFTP